MIYFHTLHKKYRFTKQYFKASNGTKGNSEWKNQNSVSK